MFMLDHLLPYPGLCPTLVAYSPDLHKLRGGSGYYLCSGYAPAPPTSTHCRSHLTAILHRGAGNH